METESVDISASRKAPWSKEQFDVAWDTLNPDVQLILIVLAYHLVRHPDGCSIKALQRRFRTSPQRIRGLLTEVNRIHKRYPRHPRLFDGDRKRRLFKIDATVAALIRTKGSQI